MHLYHEFYKHFIQSLIVDSGILYFLDKSFLEQLPFKYSCAILALNSGVYDDLDIKKPPK